MSKYSIQSISERLKKIKKNSLESKQIEYFLNEFSKILLLKEKNNILHLGCSSGFWDHLVLNNYKDKIEHFHSADIGKNPIKENDLKELQKFKNWKYFEQEKEKQFKLTKDIKYDVIIHHDTIEHVKKFNLYINESKKYLNKNGILFFSTPNLLRLTNIFKLLFNKLDFPHHMDGEGSYEHGPSIHEQEFTKFNLELLLKEYDMTDIKVEYKFFNIPFINICFDFKNFALSHLLFATAKKKY